MNKYKIPFYLVRVSGDKPASTLIRVNKINDLKYVCYYFSKDLIHQFGIQGFVVNLKENNFKEFSNYGSAGIDFLINIWEQIDSKIDDPDYVIDIEGFDLRVNDSII